MSASLHIPRRPRSGSGDVHWRVRAVRGDESQPEERHSRRDPWTVEPGLHVVESGSHADGPIALEDTVSDTISNGSMSSPAHSMAPAFVWSGDESLGGVPAQFFRVYVFTDSQCLNRVYASATVASPAYAPRVLGGPLPMPQSAGGIAAAASEFLGEIRHAAERLHVRLRPGHPDRGDRPGHSHDVDRSGPAPSQAFLLACSVPRSTSGTSSGRRAATTGRSFRLLWNVGCGWVHQDGAGAGRLRRRSGCSASESRASRPSPRITRCSRGVTPSSGKRVSATMTSNVYGQPTSRGRRRPRRTRTRFSGRRRRIRSTCAASGARGLCLTCCR